MYTRITLHLFYFFTHLFLVVLGLHCCAQDFCSCGGWGILFIAVLGLLTGGFSCRGAQALGAQASVVTVMHGLSTLGSVAVVHSLSCSAACGILKTRDESMSAALGGQFLSTGPSGKSWGLLFFSSPSLWGPGRGGHFFLSSVRSPAQDKWLWMLAECMFKSCQIEPSF